MAEAESISNRIKKLLLHAKSAKNIGSLEEAEAFTQKAYKLLEEHNLSVIDVMKNTDNEAKFKKWGYSERMSYADIQASHHWRYDLAIVLSRAYFCDFTLNTYSKTLQ